MRYVIVSPPYSGNSAGIRVLYELQKWLIRFDKDAMILTFGIPYKVEDDDIVVYPEIVPGNPLKAKKVVRYILNEPGKLGGDKEYDKNEILVAYDDGLAKYSKGVVLTIPCIEDFFSNRGYQRTIDCFWTGRLRNANHPITKNCIEITYHWPSTRRELAELFNRTRTFYTYEHRTSLISEAGFCGCDVKIIKTNEIIDVPRMAGFDYVLFKKQLTQFVELTWPFTESPATTAISFNLPASPAIKQREIAKYLVSIIILTFNKLNYTTECVENIRKHTPEKHEIVFIDNGSTDGTLTWLRRLVQENPNYKLIENTSNLGFAKACNQGANAAQAGYLLFLNNDTTPQRGWMSPLINILDNDNSVAAAGGKLLYPDNTIQHAGVVIVDDKTLPDPLLAKHIYAHKEAGFAEANEPRIYQALTAASLIVRKAAFEQIQGFDEGYWNGYEDVDLCFKLQEKGWKLVYQPESVVIHHESKSGPERFSKVSENVQRLHNRWLGRITPDVIIKEDGSTITTNNNKIHRYSIPNIPSAEEPDIKPRRLVSLIILTWNALEYTKKCVRSIQDHTHYPHEAIFVDNASTDGTVEYLRNLVQVHSNYKVIENRENRGFAAGNNQGVSAASGEYVMLLNNDVLVSGGWLESLVESLEKDTKIGMVGPITNSISGRQQVIQIPYTDEQGFYKFAHGIRGTYKGRLTPRHRVAGFAVLMRKALYEEAGGLDESFGTGNYEDDDLCLKVREKGYAIMVDESVFIHHYRSQTFIENKINYRDSLSVNESKFKDKWPNVDYEQLLELHGSLVDANTALCTRGRQALESGNITEAIEIYLKVLQTNPIDEAALCGLALVYQIDGKMDKTIDAYKKALKVNPSFFDAHYNLAIVYSSINQIDDAIAHLNKAINLNSSDASVHNNLGVLYFKKNMYNDAKNCFERALLIDAHYKEAQQNLKKVSKILGNNSSVTSHQKDTNDSPLASIIIPVFNKVAYTKKCLETLYKNTQGDSFEVIIVDNASTDDTHDFLRQASQQYKNFCYIRNEENLRFAGACNQGARGARGKYLIFLNNDTEPERGWLLEGIKRLTSSSDIGVVGVKLLYPDRTVQHCGIEFVRIINPDYAIWPIHRFRHTKEDDPRVNVPEEVHAVTGACLFIDREFFEEVGQFSEDYGMYFEDTDLCFKVRARGKKIFYEPRSVVIHHEGKSSPSQDIINNLNRHAATIFYKRWEKEIMNRIRQPERNTVLRC